MTLRPLPPVLAANIADHRLLYDWDEWDVHQYFDFSDQALEQRLAEVSGRASIALSLAVGEWICHRYSLLSSDPAPMQYLEAAWAEQLLPEQCSPVETDDDEWRGLVRGPLSLVITIANDGLFCLDEDDDVPVRAVWMTNLARHLLPEPAAFEKWLAQVLDLLVQHHPKAGSEGESLPDDEFHLGRPVARELFDTTNPYQPADEARLIAQFLQSVDSTNPYLAANESE
jgi:hypothetical protein